MKPARRYVVGVTELPDRLTPGCDAWRALQREIEAERPDLLLLNEMPFGAWVAAAASYDERAAADTVAAHAAAMPALRALPAAVLTSRPIRARHRLANEAFLLAGGTARPFHQKQYFPQEAGYFEAEWFAPERRGFDVIEHDGVRIGALLCTELMFTEWARRYRRQGAHLIVAPRASGTDMQHWEAAARMAAIMSGCYVASSNRVSRATDAQAFGGRGFVYAPTGELLCETSAAAPLRCVALDFDAVAAAQQRYPCTVRELDAPHADGA